MAAAPYWIDIHDSAILGMTLPGGDVAKAVSEIARTAARYGKQEAPRRSGKLQRGIHNFNAQSRGPYLCAAQVVARTGYSLYVHEGTDRIFAKGKFMLVPKVQTNLPVPPGRKGQGSVMFRADKDSVLRLKSVAGQTRNPFLSRALARAMAEFRRGG